MQIYRSTIELLDYVFFATVERGKVYETGAFLHNYALAYALRLVTGGTYTYQQQQQIPHYEEELSPLNGRVYLTPGGPLRAAHRLVQWNTLRDAYAFPGKPPSLGYPDWGFARVLRPGARFRFYVLASARSLPDAPALQDLIAGRTVRARFGKFAGKALLRAEPAQSVTCKEGPFHSQEYLNWQDLADDPVACDVVAASLPTRLLSQARFEGPHYVARFSDGTVCLPAEMGFLARPSPGKA